MRRQKQDVLRETAGLAGQTPWARAAFRGVCGTGALLGRVWATLLAVGMLSSSAYAFKGDLDAKTSVVAQQPMQVAAAPKIAGEQSKAAQAAAKAGVRVAWHPKGDTPSSVRGSDLGGRKVIAGGKGLRAKGGGAYREDAVAALDQLSPLFRIQDAQSEFAVVRVTPDAQGFRHARLAQRHKQLRVVGGELIVHFDSKDQVYEVNGKYIPEIAIGTHPKLQAEEAIQVARASLTEKGIPQGKLEQQPELVVYARGDEPRLAYELTLSGDDGRGNVGVWRYWIDALTGKTLFSFNDIKRILPPSTNGSHATITGNILEGEGGVVKSVQGWHENTGAYYLANTNFNWLVYNVAESGYSDAGTYAYRMGNNWGTTDRAEMSTAFGFDLIQKYYKQVHGRNSFDDAGVFAVVNVHEGIDYANAYWSPMAQQFFIGDGDGKQASSLAVLDVLAHEFTHAVTENTCNLTYAYESGALNESFSDIFGTCVEFFGQPDDRGSYPARTAGKADWLCGEDCWLSSTALRDLRNPANALTVGTGREQPTKYQGTYWYGGGLDNGGVHQNSGVQNFFFYLLCEGGSGMNDGTPYNVTGIGITNAEQIAYRALSVYCTADTDYYGARAAWVSAAEDLNTNWVRSVKRAWNAVLGVTPPVLYSPTVLTPARVGTPYSYRLGLAGGVSPYTWVMTAGDPLPDNLTFSDGVISGMPEVATTVSFSVQVTDDDGQVVSKEYSLTILPPFGIPFVETFESGGAMPDGWSQEYGQGRINWRFLNGSPQGHPASAYSNQYNAFLGVESPSQAVTRLISPRINFGTDVQAAQLTFWHHMEPWLGSQDTLRVYYKTTLEDAWTPVPDGVFVSSVSAWTKRTLTLPNPSSTYYVAFEGTARYGYGICLDEVQIFDPTPPLGITTANPLPDAIKEQAYSLALAAQGGQTPYRFHIESGELPDHFDLSEDGVISGVSSNVQSCTFTVRLTDGEEETAFKTFTLNVVMPQAAIYTESFESPNGDPNYNFTKVNGWSQEFVTNQVSWVFINGAPPASGRPASAFSGNYNACLFSSAWVSGGSFDQKTKLISPPINLGEAPASIKLTFWHYMEEFEGDQDQLRIFYRAATNAPWVSLTNAVYLTSVPAWTQRSVMLPNPSRTYQIAFEGNAHFGHGVCIDDIRITDATDAPIITTARSLPDGVIGLSYSKVLTASGGVQPYSWSVVSGSLPAGYALDSASGTISGVSTAAGLSSFLVKVSGSNGRATTNQFSLLISAARPMPFTETFEASGQMPTGWTQEQMGLPAVSWAFRSGSPVGVPTSAHSNSQYNACLYLANSSGGKAKLISPMLNLGWGTNAQARLTFWHCMAKYINDQDQLRVLYRPSATSNWEELGSFKLNVPGWTQRTFELPNATPTAYIAFEGWAKYGYGVCIDNVSVTGQSSISPYEQWKLDSFGTNAVNDAISGDTADPDGDGVANALEWAMGLDPNSADAAGLPTGGITTGYLSLSFRMDKEAFDSGVLYEVEGCTDLIGNAWTTNDVSELMPRADSNTWWQTVFQHNVPVTNAPQRFLRLKVTLP